MCYAPTDNPFLKGGPLSGEPLGGPWNHEVPHWGRVEDDEDVPDWIRELFNGPTQPVTKKLSKPFKDIG